MSFKIAARFCVLLISTTISKVVESWLFNRGGHFPPRHAAMPKRMYAEPTAPGCWNNRNKDPYWQAWMQDGVWNTAELETVTTAQHEAPVKLPLPFFSALDRSCLTAPAAQKLDEAMVIFEQRMSDTRDAPKISGRFNESTKREYDLNTPDGAYRLHLTYKAGGRAVGASGKPLKLKFNPIH